MSKRTLYGKIAVNLLFAVLLIMGCIFLVPRLIGFFFPFVIGWLIALICNPLVKLLEDKLKFMRKFSSAIIIIAVLAAVVLVIYLVGYKLIEQGVAFVKNIDVMYANFDRTLQNTADRLGERYQLFPEKITTGIQNFLLHLDDYVKELITNTKLPSLSGAGDVVKAVGNGFFMFIIALLSSYFFIADKDIIVERFKARIPKSALKNYNLITSNFKRAIGGYFKAQFKIMLIIVVILYVGFLFVHVDYAILLAFIIAFLDFLPVFGTGTVIWPWAVFDVINGNYIQAGVLLLLYVVCQVVKQLLQPKMVGDSIGMSPLTTLFVLYIGYKFAGIVGIIVAIPIGMILISLYRAGAFDSWIRDIRTLVTDLNEYRKY
ncbi:MAG: sporulation integral membrane protein YtvI [bacterium]|nr:sporulation integral membrane protein YtvI [bacterium]